MKKFFKPFLLLCLGSMASVEKIQGSHSFGFVGVNFGYNSVIQKAESDFEPSLLTLEELHVKSNSVSNPPNPLEITQGQAINQEFAMQNMSSMTPIYSTSRFAGEIFLGGEYRDSNLVFQVQIGIDLVGGKAQQRFQYSLTEQSLVNNSVDTDILANGEAFQKNATGGVDNPLIHDFHYNGINNTTAEFNVKTNGGLKALCGVGLAIKDWALVLNFGYSGVHNTASLNFFDGPLSLTEYNEAKWEKETSVLKNWSHGVLVGLQGIFALYPSIDFLMVYQKTFFMSRDFNFQKDLNQKDPNTQNQKSHGTEFSYMQDKKMDVSFPPNASNVKTASSSLSTEGNYNIHYTPESSYIGIGFRFKMGGED